MMKKVDFMQFIPNAIKDTYSSIMLEVDTMVGNQEWSVIGFQNEFRKKWGGFDLPAFIRVVEEGAGEEIIFAMYLIYALEPQWLRQYYQSSNMCDEYWRRWGMGLVFGDNQDPIAFSLVCALVKEDLTWQEYYMGELDISDDETNVYLMHHLWRERIVIALGKYKKSRGSTIFAGRVASNNTVFSSIA